MEAIGYQSQSKWNVRSAAPEGMMNQGKELLLQLRTAPWRNKKEAETYARKLSPIAIADIVKTLDLIAKYARSGQDGAHQLRCVVLQELGLLYPNKALFLPYVRALKSADHHLRQVLQLLLPLVNQVKGHEELCRHLRTTDPPLRQFTAKMLQEIGGRTTMECLLEHVQDSHFPGFDEAIQIAVTIGGFRLLPLLSRVVLKGPVKSKIAALRHLGNRELISHNKTTAARAILPALGMSADPIIEQAIRSYAAVSSEPAYFQHVTKYMEGTNTRLAAAAVEGLRWFQTPRTIVTLTKKLQASSERISRAALSALEVMGDEAILPAIVEGLNNPNINIRARAKQALTYLNENKQIDITRAVLWLLRSDNVQARREAVDLARSIHDPHGHFWPKLLHFLQDSDWWIREQVTEALLELAGHQLTQHMLPHIKSTSPIIRRWAIDILGRIKDPQSVGLLVQLAQQDDDWWVREKAIDALAALGDIRVVPYLIELFQQSPELRWNCLQAFVALNAQSTTPYILNHLESGTSEIQLGILQCLETFHHIESANQVMPLLDAEDPEVARAAFQLLHRWEAQSKHQGRVSESGSPLDRLLIFAHHADGEDLILAPNRKAYIKRHGQIHPLSEQILSAPQLESILLPHLNAKQLKELDNNIDIDFSYEVHTQQLRFRAHLFYQDGGLSAVFRHVHSHLASFEKLGLPEKVRTFGQINHGLVIFGGPTGSGKSTSLAAIIDDINRHSNRHIISLEDPIEVVHESKQSLVNQREIGSHSLSFDHALRAALRQDPDVILVGEMRDLKTISLAITAAETGHLVFGTLHTVSAETTIDRLINAFPSYQQAQIRSMLAQSLRAVVCQYLLKRKDQPGRCLASEVMINNDAIANMIRKSKQFQISSMLATFREQGMQLMDQDLTRLYESGMVYAEEVYMKAKNKQDFEKLLEESEVEQRHRASTNMSIVVGTALGKD